MIKALRCTGYGPLNLFLSETLDGCREKHMALPKGARTKRICVKGGGFCDAEPLAITPWEKHLEVQAALAAAAEALEYTYKRIAGKTQQVVIEDALTKIRKVSNG